MKNFIFACMTIIVAHAYAAETGKLQANCDLFLVGYNLSNEKVLSVEPILSPFAKLIRQFDVALVRGDDLLRSGHHQTITYLGDNKSLYFMLYDGSVNKEIEHGPAVGIAKMDLDAFLASHYLYPINAEKAAIVTDDGVHIVDVLKVKILVTYKFTDDDKFLIKFLRSAKGDTGNLNIRELKISDSKLTMSVDRGNEHYMVTMKMKLQKKT